MADGINPRAIDSEVNRCMSTTMIRDEDLLAVADDVTVWVATPDAPTDCWSLREAVAWVMSRDERASVTLFRPPGEDMRAAWVKAEQIQRLAELLRAADSDAA
jgi:hypothetical protein